MQACDCTNATNIFILVGAIVFSVCFGFVLIRKIARQAHDTFIKMWKMVIALKMGTYHDAQEKRVNDFCDKYNDNTSLVDLKNPNLPDDEF